MKNLVIGLGEVGSAVQKILGCDGLDFEKDSTADGGPYEVLNICFPWSDTFVRSVQNYVDIYKSRIVVVHSTVPVGTCDAQGWVHSPVRGVHPDLELGIRTFVKYFGGKDAHEISTEWAKLGINIKSVEKAKHTEALKLWDTTQYGLMIMIEKEIHAFCKNNDLDFDLVYTDANHTYDIGYESLNRPEVCRPYLKHVDGPIGGHCVIPNAKLLRNPLADILLKFNEVLQSAQKE